MARQCLCVHSRLTNLKPKTVLLFVLFIAASDKAESSTSKPAKPQRKRRQASELDMLMENLVEAYGNVRGGNRNARAHGDVSKTLANLQLPASRANRKLAQAGVEKVADDSAKSAATTATTARVVDEIDASLSPMPVLDKSIDPTKTTKQKPDTVKPKMSKKALRKRNIQLAQARKKKLAKGQLKIYRL